MPQHPRQGFFQFQNTADTAEKVRKLGAALVRLNWRKRFHCPSKRARMPWRHGYFVGFSAWQQKVLCLVEDEKTFCALQPLHYHSKNHIPTFPPNAFVGRCPTPRLLFSPRICGALPTPRQGTSSLGPMKGGNVIFPATTLALAGS